MPFGLFLWSKDYPFVKFSDSSSVVPLQAKVREALSRPVEEALLDGANRNPWQSIRELHRAETELAISRFSVTLTGFDMDEIREVQ